MTVPVLVLMLTAMVTALTLSLRDHAAHAAAVDLAELRAGRAATAFLTGCGTGQGCAPPAGPDTRACAAPDSVRVSVEVAWDPTMWTALSPVTATRVVAYDQGLAGHLHSLATNALPAC